MPKLTLYAFVTSPYASKVHAYLLFKSLDFDVVYVNPLRIKREVPVGRRVPVLTIGEESRPESQDIGLWLDEVFPDTPPLVFGDEEQRWRIIEMDDWISEHLITLKFASARPRWHRRLPTTLRACFKLGKVVSQTTTSPIPRWIWRTWPVLIRFAPFIRRMAKPYEGKDLDQLYQDILSTFEAILSKQDFLVTPDQPSLPDVSAWPLFMVPHALGIQDVDAIEGFPALHAWLRRMTPLLSHEKGGKALPPFVPDPVRERDIDNVAALPRPAT